MNIWVCTPYTLFIFTNNTRDNHLKLHKEVESTDLWVGELVLKQAWNQSILESLK